MTTAARAAVDAYYETLTGGMRTFSAERLRAILDPALAFDGPLAGRVDGAERFIGGVQGFAETVRGIEVLQRVHEDDRASALYDATMPAGTVRFAEFFVVRGGLIASLTLLYNGPDYLAAGGR